MNTSLGGWGWGELGRNTRRYVRQGKNINYVQCMYILIRFWLIYGLELFWTESQRHFGVVTAKHQRLFYPILYFLLYGLYGLAVWITDTPVWSANRRFHFSMSQSVTFLIMSQLCDLGSQQANLIRWEMSFAWAQRRYVRHWMMNSGKDLIQSRPH